MWVDLILFLLPSKLYPLLRFWSVFWMSRQTTERPPTHWIPFFFFFFSRLILCFLFPIYYSEVFVGVLFFFFFLAYLKISCSYIWPNSAEYKIKTIFTLRTLLYYFKHVMLQIQSRMLIRTPVYLWQTAFLSLKAFRILALMSYNLTGICQWVGPLKFPF